MKNIVVLSEYRKENVCDKCGQHIKRCPHYAAFLQWTKRMQEHGYSIENARVLFAQMTRHSLDLP